MSQTILKSQERSAGRFFNTTEQSVDILIPASHGTSAEPLSMEKSYASVKGSENFNQTNTWDIPNCYLKDMYLMINLSAPTSGNYIYPGLQIVDRMELLSGSNVLQSFQYGPAIHECLSRMDSKTVSSILSMSGGSSFTSGWCLVPIPCFFGGVANNFQDQSPLNTNLQNGSLTLRLTYKPVANILSASANSAGTAVTGRLYYIQMHTTSALRGDHILNKESYSYKAHDFVTLPRSTAIPTGVSTNLDISGLTGSLSDISVFHKLVTDIDDVNNDLLNQGDVDELKLLIDNAEYWISEQNESLNFDKILLNDFKGTTQTIGDPSVIPLASGHNPQHYSGSLEAQDVQSLRLVLKHSAGADVYVDVLSRVNVFYILQAGKFLRVA